MCVRSELVNGHEYIIFSRKNTVIDTEEETKEKWKKNKRKNEMKWEREALKHEMQVTQLSRLASRYAQEITIHHFTTTASHHQHGQFIVHPAQKYITFFPKYNSYYTNFFSLLLLRGFFPLSFLSLSWGKDKNHWFCMGSVVANIVQKSGKNTSVFCTGGGPAHSLNDVKL